MSLNPFHSQVERFWHDILGYHIHELGIWSYLILALIVMIEGPVATLIASAAAASGFLRPLPVFLAAATGNLTGDVIWVSLGRMGKTEWLVRHGRWLGFHHDEVDRFLERVRARSREMLFIAKLTLIFAIPALLATGASRTPLRRWLPVDMVAECIWTGGLVSIGFFLMHALHRVELGIQLVTMVGTGGLIAGCVKFAARRRAVMAAVPSAEPTGNGSGE